ncbi:unnamed protein product [Rhizoctonia solani]|uniref:EF-hand domain-containing protein n=1 Tax=Rhizoctonia solani TaxID=456999 RepID=A0A8H3HFC8_9AGAM|nr:unnamed protein product [Rhizoctonia solani]
MSEPKGSGVLASKDFGDFNQQKDTIKARSTHAENSKRARILELITSTEEHLQTSNSIIQNAVTLGESFKVTKQIVNTLLAPAKDLADLLGSLSEIHPAIGVVATIFQAVVKLEIDRQENDKQIAVLYDSMSHMLIILAYMEEIFERKDGIQHLLKQKLDDIANLIKEFGNFCDVYYKHRSIVRFLRSAKYKEMLAEFAQRFESTKTGLHSLITHRTAKLVEKTSGRIDEVAASVSELVKFMDIQTSRERETAALVATNGGTEAVLKDDKLLNEIAQKLGEQINASVQLSLRQDLGQQLADNYVFFDIKMQAVQEQITEAINHSTSAILLKMEDGPHELIYDPDIKQIWKGKYGMHRGKPHKRHFVSAVHHHFEQTFIRYRRKNGAPHPDLWTLNYLSRVIFYPAIGDAIDEDSSGYVSLHELNHFFDSKPQDWSVPQWLAYWAAGWYKDNLRYRDKIMSRLKFLEGAVDSMQVENKEILRIFIENIKFRIRLIVESLYDHVLDYFEEESAESTRLDDLRNKITEMTTKAVEDQLTKSKFEIDDKRTLMLVLGRSRFESRLFCVMHRLLKRHHKVFDLGKDKPLQKGVTTSMITSWDVIFDAFEKRMRALCESWRQQRMNIELQVQWYANGLFEDWYKFSQSIPEPEDDYGDAWAEEDYDAGTEVDEDELAEYATRPPTATGYYDDDVPSISHPLDEEEDPNDATETQTVASVSDQTLHPAENSHGRSSSRTPSESGKYYFGVAELEERMSKLEGKVDNLTDLMTQILQHIKDK